MNIIINLVILIITGLICAFIHKKKGYSPIAGFCWGFFFFIIGLFIVLSERNKEEQIEADNGSLSMMQWLLIFLGIGILLIGIILVIANFV